MAERFYFLLGKDTRYASYNGAIAYVRIHLGKGAFNTKYDGDFNGGADKLISKIEEVDHKVTDIISVGANDESPKIIELPDDKLPRKIEEYGYGFWLRFLTLYPERLLQGKNAPWYFVARLTANA